MKTRYFFTTMCLLFAASVCHAFTCNVSIGSAEASTSLTFGNDSTLQQPFPPFSGQFGVKDFYLVNQDSQITGDLTRLGTDTRSGADTWKISCTNANSTLYFSYTGTHPTLYYAYTDPKDSKTVSGTLTDQLSVKAYTVVTISTTQPQADPIPDDDRFAEKKDDGTYQTAGKKISFTAGEEIEAVLNAGTAEIVVCINGEYYNTTGKINNFVLKDFTGYICSFTHSGISFKSYADGLLTLNSTPAPTRSDESTLTYQVTATNSNLPNLTTTIGDQLLLTIIEKFGTLDFDGNGVVNNNDALFFYNYVGIGGADIPEEITPYADTTLTKDILADATAALKFFKEMDGSLQDLSLVSTDEIGDNINKLSDSATFFYNYMGIGGADLPEEITPYTSRKKNTDQDLKDAQEAMDNIKSMLE